MRPPLSPVQAQRILQRGNVSERQLNRIPALPNFTGGRRPVGATRMTQRSVIKVQGSTQMKLIEQPDGTMETMIWLGIPNADLLSPADLSRLNQLLGSVERGAVGMSQGRLSTRDLRRMGHPYGWGKRKGLGRLQGNRRGVSNMAIVNRQTGAFQADWSSEMNRAKDGVSLSLSNSNPVAKYLAKGTRRMRAHYPGNTAMARQLSAIRSEQERLKRIARTRNNALEQFSYARLGLGLTN